MSSATPPPIADDVELLRVYLAERDVACPQCRYNLRNLVGTRCPECGEELLLRVAAAEPRQAAPLAGLVMLSAGAGLNALLLIYALIEISSRGGGRGLGKFIAVNAVEFTVNGPVRRAVAAGLARHPPARGGATMGAGRRMRCADAG